MNWGFIPVPWTNQASACDCAGGGVSGVYLTTEDDQQLQTEDGQNLETEG